SSLADIARLGEDVATIGSIEIDDVAQQHLALDQRVAPTDKGTDRERALADAADHHVAAGLDALGDRDLALARQQLDRPHLAQIHAHGIVGAADIVVDVAARLALAVLGLTLGFGGILALFAFDNVDAELGEHRHRVLNLLRGHLILRQCGVQLVIGQIPALLAARDHLLDRDGDRIEERRLGHILAGFCRLCCCRRLARHAAILYCQPRDTPPRQGLKPLKLIETPAASQSSGGASLRNLYRGSCSLAPPDKNSAVATSSSVCRPSNAKNRSQVASDGSRARASAAVARSLRTSSLIILSTCNQP